MAGVACGLDFSAIMSIGAGQGADLEMLSDVLPDVEVSIVDAMSGDTSED
jgi:hypothetical protein